MKRYYSLPEVAEGTRLDHHMKNAERWLADQIRANRIRATKLGRSWFMSDEQIEAMLDSLENRQPVEEKPVQQVVEITRRGPSAASLRRRAS